MSYEVKLEIFEGPLDLLLHLINKNEVDIFEIPIAVIADQYLEYLDMMKALNIDIAGDFLIMASTLIHLKSKMLLPGLEEEGEEDLHIEITRPLLEYLRFKEIAEELSNMDLLARDIFSRQLPPHLQAQIEDEEPQLDVNLFQLVDAFKRLMDQKLPGEQLKFSPEEWSVKKQEEFIISILKQRGSVFFREIFGGHRNLLEFVVTFLALLELVHMGLIKVVQTAHENDIRLIPSLDENNGDCNG